MLLILFFFHDVLTSKKPLPSIRNFDKPSPAFPHLLLEPLTCKVGPETSKQQENKQNFNLN